MRRPQAYENSIIRLRNASRTDVRSARTFRLVRGAAGARGGASSRPASDTERPGGVTSRPARETERPGSVSSRLARTLRALC